MDDPVEVLEFWLGTVGPKGWYAGGEELDAMCRDQCLDLWQAAKDGGLDHWVDGTVGTLAFLILTDQLPRNMFRGPADSFRTDPLALSAARRALDEGWDMGAPEPERQFFYMPFEHSEDTADQARAVRLMEDRLPSDPDMAALGRENTAAETAFLTEGGYGAVVAALQASHAKDA